MKRFAGACLGLLLAAASPAFAEDIVIGVQAPLSGPLASISSPQLKVGTELGVERVNALGMLGKGHTLKALIEDNASDVNQAITLMNRFAVSDKTIAAFGVLSTFLCLPSAPVANTHQMPFLAIASSPQVAQTGPWIFNIVEPPPTQFGALADLAINRLHVKNIAIVYDRANAASVSLKEGMAARLKAANINVVSTDGITKQESNFSTLATKLVDEKIDAMFIDSIPSVSANLIIQIRQAGLDPSVRVLMGGQVSSPVFFAAAGPAAEGVYYTADYFTGLDNDENKYLVDNYRKRVGTLPDQTAAWAYSGILLLGHAIADAGPSPDRDKVRVALGKLKNVVVPLADGSFTFDQNRVPTYPVLIIHVVDGKPTLFK